MMKTISLSTWRTLTLAFFTSGALFGGGDWMLMSFLCVAAFITGTPEMIHGFFSTPYFDEKEA